jgi:hypothetical protein
VQTFVDLVGRHEGSFYNFVHQVHSKGQGVFDDLMKWIEHVINFVRDGLPDPMSLEFVLPHAGPERARTMAEIDAVVEYHRKLKEAHHERMRRRMVRGEGTERDEDAAFVEGVMDQLSMGDMAEAMGELNAEDSEEDDDGDNSSEDLGSRTSLSSSQRTSPAATQRAQESVDSLSASVAGVSLEDQIRRHTYPTTRQHPSPTIDTNVGRGSGGPPSGRATVESPVPMRKTQGRRKKDRVVIDPPELVYIPQLVPVFVEMLRPALDRACRRRS